MRYKSVVIAFFALFLPVLLSAQSDYQNIQLKFVTPLDFQRWVTLDDFEFNKVNNWEFNATSQKSADQAGSSTEIKTYFKKTDPSLTYSSLKSGRFLTDSYKNNASCLGVKVVFPELIRASVLLKAKEPYALNGFCKKLALWVLGRGRDVDLDIVVKDYMGRYYPVRVAKLDFLGWRYCEVDIPRTIPQSYNLFPQRMLLEIVGFQVTQIPRQFSDEIHKPFYVYFDQMEALLDQYSSTYPGLNVSDDW